MYLKKELTIIVVSVCVTFVANRVILSIHVGGRVALRSGFAWWSSGTTATSLATYTLLARASGHCSVACTLSSTPALETQPAGIGTPPPPVCVQLSVPSAFS